RRRRADVGGGHPVQRLGQPDGLDGGAPGRAEPGQRLGDRTGGEELPVHRSGWSAAPLGRGCSRAAAPPLSSPRTLTTGPSATWPNPQMEVLRMASSSRITCARLSSSSSEPESTTSRRIVCALVEPTRHGTHLPHDSSRKNRSTLV